MSNEIQINTADTNSIGILKDPFKKDGIKEMFIHVWKSNFTPFEVTHSGSVKFKNGDTEGVQRFNADSLPDLLKKMDSFINSLK